MWTRLAIERAGAVTLHLQRDALYFYPNKPGPRHCPTRRTGNRAKPNRIAAAKRKPSLRSHREVTPLRLFSTLLAISNNVGGVKHCLSTLRPALGKERHLMQNWWELSLEYMANSRRVRLLMSGKPCLSLKWSWKFTRPGFDAQMMMVQVGRGGTIYQW